MTTMSIAEIQSDLLGFFRRLAAGEKIVIVDFSVQEGELIEISANQPLPVEKAVEEEAVKPSTNQLRPFGLCTGEFRVPDDFDEPLPEEIISQFEGG